MPIIIRLPDVLKSITGKKEIEVEGRNISEAINNVCKEHPEIKERLFKVNGEINPFLIICLNGEDMRFLNKFDTIVKDRDEISIIPAMAGGIHRQGG